MWIKLENHADCLIAALGVSPSKIERVAHAIPYIDILFCNASEAAALSMSNPEIEPIDPTDLITRLRSKGCKHLVMTYGKDDVWVMSSEQHIGRCYAKSINAKTTNAP